MEKPSHSMFVGVMLNAVLLYAVLMLSQILLFWLALL